MHRENVRRLPLPAATGPSTPATGQIDTPADTPTLEKTAEAGSLTGEKGWTLDRAAEAEDQTDWENKSFRYTL